MNKIYDLFSSNSSNPKNNKLNITAKKKKRHSDRIVRKDIVGRSRTLSNSSANPPNVSEPNKLSNENRSKSMMKLNVNKDIINKQEDKYKISYIKKQDLRRNIFSIEVISKIGWWPDEMLRHIQIGRLIYISFMQNYLNEPSIFDRPLRNAIYFMNQKPYCEDNIISKFIKNNSTEISDNYWLKVVQEDNCYMGEYEDRKRSTDTEAKHFNLLKSIMKLLKYKEIKYDNLLLNDEYIKLLNIYVSIYLLKNMLAMIDEILRKLIISALENNVVELYLPDIFINLINDDIKKNVLYYAKRSKNQELLNRVYLIKDILLYASYSTLEFDHIFNGKKSQNGDYIINNAYLSFLSMEKNKKYRKYFKKEAVRRIECVYRLYMDKLARKQNHEKLVMNNSDNFELLQEESDRLNRSRSNTITPRYVDTSKTKTNRNNYMLSSHKFSYDMDDIINNDITPIFPVDDDDSQSNDDNAKIKKHKKFRSTSVNDFTSKDNGMKSSSSDNNIISSLNTNS